MTAVMGIARDPKDFEESLRHVEGGFVVIQDAAVDFINPSVRDYLASYLTDELLLISVMSTARTDALAREVWTFAKEQLDWTGSGHRCKCSASCAKHAFGFGQCKSPSERVGRSFTLTGVVVPI